MDIYLGMYYKLFNKITDIINELEIVQKEVEEMDVTHDTNRKTPLAGTANTQRKGDYENP